MKKNPNKRYGIVNNDMADYFDKLAPEWGKKPSDNEKLVTMMNLTQGSIIADIGCGKGALTENLLKTSPLKIEASKQLPHPKQSKEHA